MIIKLTELHELVINALARYGYTIEESKIIAEVLLYAQKRGNNQGIVKLIGKGIPKSTETTAISIVSDRKATQLIDGGKNMGMVVMHQGAQTAIQKAKEYGISVVGITNTFSSTGAIGYFARMIAQQRLVGVVMASSPETVAPHGSYEPQFGTNPIAYGFPAIPDPIVFDMATSAMAWFGLVEAKTAGKSIPADVAYDAEGKETTDPSAAMDGAIRTFDRSYKGYGLSLMVELFAGPMIGAAVAGIGSERGWGNTIIAIDPTFFVSFEQLQQDMKQAVAKIKASKPLMGAEVLLPGEKGDRLARQVDENGEIDIEENLLAQLRAVVN